MKVQQILPGTILVAVAIVVTGCSETKIWSTGQSWKPPVPDLSLRSPKAASRGSRDEASEGPLAIARLSERRGQTEQAERIYERTIEKDPQNPTPYHRLGVIRARQGKLEEADNYFAEALRLAPSDPVLLGDVGYSYYLQHRLDEAETILRRALEVKPGEPTICNNLAMVLGEQGRYGESLALFKQTGTEAEAYSSLAFIYTQQGELEKAKASYSRALTLDQNLRPAGEALVQIAEREQLHQQLPAGEPTVQPDSELIAEAIPARTTEVETAAWPQTREAQLAIPAWPRTDETRTQQAAFVRDEPTVGTATVADSAATERGASRDLWNGLKGFVSGPTTPDR